MTSVVTSPTKPRYDGHTALTPWYPQSERSSAASSPPRGRSLPGHCSRQFLLSMGCSLIWHLFCIIKWWLFVFTCVLGRTPRIDGKEFFRQARFVPACFLYIWCQIMLCFFILFNSLKHRWISGVGSHMNNLEHSWLTSRSLMLTSSPERYAVFLFLILPNV